MKALIITVIGILAGGPAAASGADIYNVFDDCGPGGKGVVSIEDGGFVIDSHVFDRTTDKNDLGDGFFEATYDRASGGKPRGPERVIMRITDEEVEFLFGNGNRLSATRCR